MKRALLLALAGVVTSCIGTGTETGNPSITSAKVGLSAFSSDSSAVAIPPPDAPVQPEATVVVNEAWISIHELELVRSSECGAATTSGKVRLRDLVGDLAQGPLLSRVDVPVTDYCRVKIEIQKPEDDVGPTALGKNTILISGLRGDGIPFELATEREYEIELRSQAGFEIDRLRSALVVAFDATRWFDDVDLSAAEVDGEGTSAHIRIDEGHNEALLQAFEASVARSLGVYRDDDEDGSVDDDEYEGRLDDDDDDD